MNMCQCGLTKQSSTHGLSSASQLAEEDLAGIASVRFLWISF